MALFTIKIESLKTFGNEIHMEMEPRSDVMEVAERLSLAYPGQRVSVQMFTRIRRAYEDGTVVFNQPSLDAYYPNMTDQDKWDWVCWGQVED